MRIRDQRFFRRVLADGAVGFGESYMEGWWDCDALDELSCRVTRARLDERVPVNLRTVVATLAARVFDLQTRRRA